MPGRLIPPVARRAVDVLGDRAALLVIVGGAGLLALGAALVDAPAALVVGLAALPLVLSRGQDRAFPLVVGLLVVRTLTDNSGNALMSIAIAMAITAIGALVLLGTRGVAVPTAALLVWCFASAAAGSASHGATATFGEAFRLTSVVAVAIVAAYAPGRLTVQRLTGAVQLVALVPAVLAIYQLLTGTGTDIAGSIRASGTLAHPNSAAMLFALANLATFSRVIQGTSGRLGQTALLGVFLVAQASTGSVGGITAMIAMTLVYLFARPVRRADRIALTTASLGIGTVLVLTSSIGVARLNEFANPQPSKETSLEWRVSAWGDVVAAWRRHVLLGNGLGSTLAETIVVGNIPHNEYVRLLAEVGVLGTLGVAALSLAVAVSVARRGRRSSEPQAASLALAALAGTAVNSLAANTMLYSASFYVTMLVVGGCWRILRDNPTSPDTPDMVPRLTSDRPASAGEAVLIRRRSLPGRSETH